MPDKPISDYTDEELDELYHQVVMERRDREVIKNAEAEAEKIKRDSEEQMQEVSRRFLKVRDRDAAADPDSVPAWVAPTGAHDAYPQDYRVMHNGKEWVNTHVLNSWEPGTTNSQWIEVTPPATDPETGEPVLIEWGVGQFVRVGEERSYNGHLWVAAVEHVTHEGWVPSLDAYAVWNYMGPIEEVVEPPVEEPPVDEPPVEEPPVEEPPTDTYPAWSANDTYTVGDVVSHNDKLWECLVAHGPEQMGGWAPGVAHTVWKELGPA